MKRLSGIITQAAYTSKEAQISTETHREWSGVGGRGREREEERKNETISTRKGEKEDEKGKGQVRTFQGPWEMNIPYILLISTLRREGRVKTRWT